MNAVSKEVWLAALRAGDIGLSRAFNPFAVVQNWYRKKFKEGALTASHGFYLREPPKITEANGLFISDNSTIIKNIGDKTLTWVFRNVATTPAQVSLMNAAADMAVKSGGHYSVMGIVQFGIQFFGIRKRLVDEGGVFCTEFTGDLITLAGLPYVQGRSPYEVDPSFQLNWMMGDGQAVGWRLVGNYDGKGGYFLGDAT